MKSIVASMVIACLSVVGSIAHGASVYSLNAEMKFQSLPKTGSIIETCNISGKFTTASSIQFWVNRNAENARLSCGEGINKEMASIAISIKVAPVLWRMGEEKLFNATIVWQPTSESKVKTQRTIFFVEEAKIPIYFPTSDNHPEIVAQLSLSQDDVEIQKGFGKVTVISDLIGAEVFVDGALAGKINNDKELLIRNLQRGLHEIQLLQQQGQSISRVVDVVASRVTLIALTLAQSSKTNEVFQLRHLGKNSKNAPEYQRLKDNVVVVEIPGGPFLMGNKTAEMNPLEHTVSVDKFLIDKNIVTFGQYKKFLAERGGMLPPSSPYWGMYDDHPATFVTWEDAKAYCEWVGGRLPTEAEREKAARGTDKRQYPWGKEEPAPELAVFRHGWGNEATEPVGIRPKGASPYGVMDMSGQVWQFVADWYDGKYFEVSPKLNPKGPRTANFKAVKGGSWDSRPTVLTASSRNFAYRGYREGDFGFRCAMDAMR